MKANRADWAASVPFSGITDWPGETPGAMPWRWGSITGNLSAQTDLATALSAKQDRAGLARVATSGLYSDLRNPPSLGSAAFASASDFANVGQGVLADSALQPGDNVSTLVNDAGYLTSAGAVTSIAGTANEIAASASTGAVTLSLPAALTFTGKTVTGGTLNPVAINASGAIVASFANALIQWNDTGGAANNRRADFQSTGAAFVGRLVNDANSAAASWLVVNRTANTADSVALQADSILLRSAGAVTRGTLDGTGLLLTGSVKTGVPTAGAAGAWKLGVYTAGVAVQAGKVRVNIDGADYDLLTA